MVRQSTRQTPWIPLLLLAFVLDGCSSSTDPAGGGDGGSEVAFTPPGTRIEVRAYEAQIFAVEAPAEAEAVVEYRRGEEVLAQTREYEYVAGSVGQDTISVTVVWNGTTWTHRWIVDVIEGEVGLPPAVGGLAAAHGVEPGSVDLIWGQPPESEIERPLADFLVAVSYAGIIDEDDWPEADFVTAVPVQTNSLNYEVTLSAAANGLQAGRTAWFAVRARDVDGRLSPLSVQQNVSIRISAPYWIEGFVVGDDNERLAGAFVSYVTDYGNLTTASDDDGFFRMGPLHDFLRVLLTTSSVDDRGTGYYDLIVHPDRADSVGVDSGFPITLPLIRRHELAACGATDYDGEFLTFFRHVTNTNYAQGSVTNNELHKWETYPVSVYVPEGSNNSEENPVDFRTEMLWAIEKWNTTMGEDYFTVTDDEEGAQIVCVWEAAGVLGNTEIILPTGSPTLGLVIPQKMRIRITNSIAGDNARNLARAVAVHELGHTLGFGSHSHCNDHIMYFDVDPVSDDELADLITVDEQRVVRYVRYLPQNLVMAGYEAP